MFGMTHFHDVAAPGHSVKANIIPLCRRDVAVLVYLSISSVVLAYGRKMSDRTVVIVSAVRTPIGNNTNNEIHS